ncbi:MAG: hypothetical protein ACOC7Z_01305 [Candidatus Bipolaricaulota bacterium]
MQNEEVGFDYKRYAGAIEEALGRVAAKNGVVSIRQVQLETSVPKDLIVEVLDKDLVEFPDRIDKIIDTEEGKSGRDKFWD